MFLTLSYIVNIILELLPYVQYAELGFLQIPCVNPEFLRDCIVTVQSYLLRGANQSSGLLHVTQVVV